MHDTLDGRQSQTVDNVFVDLAPCTPPRTECSWSVGTASTTTPNSVTPSLAVVTPSLGAGSPDCVPSPSIRGNQSALAAWFIDSSGDETVLDSVSVCSSDDEKDENDQKNEQKKDRRSEEEKPCTSSKNRSRSRSPDSLCLCPEYARVVDLFNPYRNMFPEIQWKLQADPERWVSHQLAQGCWCRFKIGLTHNPVFRMFGVQGPLDSVSVTMQPHALDWKRMWLIFIGSADAAASMESTLIDKWWGDDRLSNSKAGGEGATAGHTYFVYVLENSLSEFMEIETANRKQWLQVSANRNALRKAQRMRLKPGGVLRLV